MTKGKLIKFLKENKVDVQNATASIFVCDLVYPAYAESDEVHGFNFSPVSCYVGGGEAGNFYQLLIDSKIKQIARKMYLDFRSKNKILDQRIKEHKRLSNKLDLIWHKYQKNKGFLSNKELFSIYNDLIHTSRKWWHYGVIGEDKGEVINLEVVPCFAARHKIDENKAREIVSLLSHPEDQSILNLERKSYLDIILYILKNKKFLVFLKNKNFKSLFEDKKLIKKINTYINDYFWINSDFYKAIQITPDILLERVYQDIKTKSKNDVLNEIKSIDKNFKKIHEKQKAIRKKIKLSKNDEKDIYFSKRTAYWIDWRKLGMMKQLYYVFSFIKDIAEKFNLDYKEISFHTIDEVGKLLKNYKRVLSRELRKRECGVFMLFEKGKKVKFYYGDDGKKLFNIVRHTDQGGEIKGMIASTGGKKIITGRVKLIKDPSKDSFNKGDILVTSMTRVEFVPLMRMAKAIITNEGGIASHAAIISRELGLPCIIGTKIATERFKNGDLIEMDLENGIIKILKRK